MVICLLYIFRFEIYNQWGGVMFTGVFLEAGTLTGNWPTHDPCGGNAQNHLHGVADPGGAIYIGPDPDGPFDDSAC